MTAAPSEIETTASGVDTLLQYYVYELRDPRNNELFYVGKGTRDRVNHHDSPDEDADGTEKERRIASIREAGYPDCIRLVIGRYRTEEEAFAVEATLIKWVYGRDNLTNLVAGHRDRFIRSSHQRSSWEPSKDPAYDPVPQIDLPKREAGVRDGTYTQYQIQTAIDNAVEEKLESLRPASPTRPHLRSAASPSPRPRPSSTASAQRGRRSSRGREDRQDFLRKRGFSKAETGRIVETVLPSSTANRLSD